MGLKAAKYSLLLFLRPMVVGAALPAHAAVACHLCFYVDGYIGSLGNYVNDKWH